MSVPATTSIPRPRRPRYCVGIELPRDLDGRSSSARRFKQLCRSFSEELGAHDLSPVDRELIAQAAAMFLRADQIRAEILSKGKTVDADALIRLGSESRRVLGMLGLKSKQSSGDLSAFLDDKYGA